MSEEGAKTRTGGGRFQWFGNITAVIAFAISLFTFYSSNIRELDDFELSLSGVVSSQNAGLNNQTFNFISALSATFINAGTRPVAVEQIELIVVQGAQDSGDNVKDCQSDATYSIDIQPFVVKTQELEVRNLTEFKKLSFQQFQKDGAAIIKFSDPKARNRHMIICVALSFIVPDHPPQSRFLKIFSGDWPSSSVFSPSSDQPFIFEGAPPLVLLQETSYSLFNKGKSKSDELQGTWTSY